MAHPVLLAGGAAAVLALLFGSKKAHAMPANNGGGLQPPSAPPGGILGPTSAPAPSSGLPNNGVTAPYSYNSDDSGSVDFPTGNGVSAPAYNAPPAPSQSDGIGTFSNSDDNLPTAAADSGAAGYDPNFLLSPGNPIDASGGDTSVSGPLDDYASAVSGPYDSYTAAVVAGTGARKARRGRVGDSFGNVPPPGWTDPGDGTTSNPNLFGGFPMTISDAWSAWSDLPTDQGPSIDPFNLGNPYYGDDSGGTAVYDATMDYGASVQGLSHHHGLEHFSAHVGAPLPYRKGRKNPTASNHLPPHRGARVGASRCSNLAAEIANAKVTHQRLESLYGSGTHPITGEEDAELEQAEARLATLQYDYNTTCRGAQKARVGASLAPSGLVYDRHGNWTHAYPGHRWGAPPPAGQPIF